MKIQVSEIEVKSLIRIDSGNLQELVENIRDFGLLHPLVVRQIQEGKYELVAGYRRLQACQQLGWTEIPVTVVNAEDELRKLDTQLHENLRRKDLNYLELAEAILDRRKYWEQINGVIEMGRPPGSRIEEKSVRTAETFIKNTSEICKLSDTMIYNLLQLNELDSDLKEQVRERSLPYRKALSLQSERNSQKVNKKSISKKTIVRPIAGLPNQERCVAFSKQFSQAPNLARLIFVMQHVWDVIGQFKEREIEWDSLDLEYSFTLMKLSGETREFINKILDESGKIQERLLKKS